MASRSGDKDLFISYGREEGVKLFVRRLKRDLEAAGLRVWLDIDDIPTGSEWPKEIGIALRNSKALIAVVTKKYVSSRYCKGELYIACGERKKIYPVIYEDGWDSSDDGAGVQYMVAAENWAMFRPGKDDYSISLEKLTRGMAGASGISIPQVAAVQEADHSGSTDEPDTPCSSASFSTWPQGRLDERPKLSELRTLKLPNGEKVEIINSLAPHWKDCGILFEFDDDGRHLDLIETKHRGDPVTCCTEVFQYWLKDKGKQPTTWDTLLEILDDCEENYLVKRVRKGLHV